MYGANFDFGFGKENERKRKNNAKKTSHFSAINMDSIKGRCCINNSSIKSYVNHKLWLVPRKTELEVLDARNPLESKSSAQVQFLIDSCCLVSQSNRFMHSYKRCDCLKQHTLSEYRCTLTTFLFVLKTKRI